MNLEEINWMKKPRMKKYNVSIGTAVADKKFDLPNCIGIDPGRNFGIGVLRDGELSVMWGKLPKCEKDWEYYNKAKMLVLSLFAADKFTDIGVVEGPSYGSIYKQPMLEDVRVGFLLGLHMVGVDADYCPPQTARKAVFGKGTTKASEVWLDVNSNAADGGALVLWKAGYEHTLD